MNGPKNRSANRAILRLRTGILETRFNVNGREFFATVSSGRLFVQDVNASRWERSKSVPWNHAISWATIDRMARDIVVTEVMET